MKRTTKAVLSMGFATIIGMSALASTACSLFKSDTKTLYFITYNDGKDQKIRIYDGDRYTIPYIPEAEFGYTFDGWYDAETGGTKFTTSYGESIGPFSSSKDVTLYPQFAPKTYTLRLNYGEATASGEATISVLYDHTLPQLPIGRAVTGKDFCGWYTRADCDGLQVSSSDGVSQIVLNKTNFNLNKEYIYLYAGYKPQTRTVTFRNESGTLIKKAQVDYGSSLEEAANAVRVNGMGVLKWKSSAAGKVTKDIELVAEEYAPVIELDLRGGTGTKEVIALAGSAIVLPTPEKEANNFSYWADESGKKYTSAIMPKESICLKAVWQPKIVFDSNGGSAEEDIVQAAGAAITLPIPTRAGYLFAGWYTKDDVLYQGTKMPADGVVLKAGWYRTKTANKVVIESGKNYTPSSKFELKNNMTIDLSELLPKEFYGMIKVSGSIKLKHQNATLSSPYIMTLGFYSDKVISDSTELMEQTKFSVTSNEYEMFDFSFEGFLTGNKIYGAISSQVFGNALLGMYHYGYYSDMSVALTYADASVLYL